MRADTWQQAFSLLLFTALGAVLALLYCALTPLRRASGRLGGMLYDLLFSVLAGAAIFLLSMYAPGTAQAGLWEFGLTAASFCIFMLTLGECILRFFQILCVSTEYICIKIKNFFKKSSIFAKLFFTNEE